MVTVRRAPSWRAVTSLFLLSVSAAARFLFVVVIFATDAQLLAVAMAKFSMASTFFYRFTWLAAWWSTIFAAWYPAPAVVACDLHYSWWEVAKKILNSVQVLLAGSCLFHCLQLLVNIPV